MSFQELRICPRHNVPWTMVEYALQHNNRHEIYIGIVINVSERGLCLNTIQQLYIGQVIDIRSSVPEFAKTAVVRWTENITVSFCRVGLEFCDVKTKQAAV